MALLRNREVTILRVAHEIDGSTFVVKYPDGETEIVKMHELIFTQAEYDQFVKPDLPSVQILSDADMQARKEQLKSDEDKPGTDAYKAKQERIKNEKETKDEEIKPQSVKQAASLDGAKIQSKPVSQNPGNRTPTNVVNK